MKKISQVAIIRCPDYDAGRVAAAVERGFDVLGGISAFFRAGESVLLKPNMLSAKKPDVAVTTHPEFLRAVSRVFKKITTEISAGDSPGGAVSGTGRVWNETGIGAVCESENLYKVIFEKTGSVPFESQNPRNKRIKTIDIAKAALDADALVSLPKMKTHTLMLFTGAIKNLYGCVPGLRKAHYHFMAVHPDDFAELLADITLIVKPRFSIVDAIVSMEGEGPSAGEQRRTGLIIMGADSVAVDAVMAAIMGFDPLRDHTLKACARLGLGTADLSRIEIVGDGRLEDFIIGDFKKPSNWKIRMVPRFLGPLVKKIFWAKPRIDADVCTRCRICYNTCPAKAIFFEKDRLVVDKSLCIECMCCHELCPDKAIDIEYSRLADVLTRRSSARRK
ncbi:MAG: hypothetical protein CVU77_06005 [Elusimicrobia bacterium HGW-Elusimicrobia-1]|jgi:uncharacterized protein (DUF362 family)/Pyruvate/2-oxoacid:ferredoxin oxidoreductase delta subunit|nr:MAG: hypothetical protein CVU79_08385 [Elusimicrobia bacterium HGW-Elusimicrobia-3]PKN01233.1 MAG: hypothetical protein CVU77_06005 [Elusimicrobia bacterium HGW-Elusimicrobia-1]